MKRNPIREQLNAHKWDARDLDTVWLTVRQRGSPGDEARIHGAEIAEIKPDGAQLQGEDGAFIPFHRILRIKKSAASGTAAGSKPAPR